MKNYVFYFLVGSQYLYGPEAIEQVNADAEKIAAGLNENPLIPCRVVCKPCAKTSAEVSALAAGANADENCAGVITWMHTFSPSKMWIAGL